jgi:hypothetical protein
MGIETMVFSSMKQILNDVHDADASMLTLFRKQWNHLLVRFVHEIVQNDQVFTSGVEGVQVRQSVLKVHAIYGSVYRLIFTITPQDAIWYWGHHMSDIVNESPDKDRFSTSGWSRDHTGKRMDPWHEVPHKFSAGYFKHEWVARRVNKVRFLCFSLVL